MKFYTILSSEDLNELERKIRFKLENGFVLIGGPLVDRNLHRLTFYQAVAKPDDAVPNVP